AKPAPRRPAPDVGDAPGGAGAGGGLRCRRGGFDQEAWGARRRGCAGDQPRPGNECRGRGGAGGRRGRLRGLAREQRRGGGGRGPDRRCAVPDLRWLRAPDRGFRRERRTGRCPAMDRREPGGRGLRPPPLPRRRADACRAQRFRRLHAHRTLRRPGPRRRALRGRLRHARVPLPGDEVARTRTPGVGPSRGPRGDQFPPDHGRQIGGSPASRGGGGRKPHRRERLRPALGGPGDRLFARSRTRRARLDDGSDRRSDPRLGPFRGHAGVLRLRGPGDAARWRPGPQRRLLGRHGDGDLARELRPGV
ncbi:MAG: hypothetical protein AVDCRST_MAG01-01-2310, partial [uncultured Rubrobacteraceae bacterium]